MRISANRVATGGSDTFLPAGDGVSAYPPSAPRPPRAASPPREAARPDGTYPPRILAPASARPRATENAVAVARRLQAALPAIGGPGSWVVTLAAWRIAGLARGAAGQAPVAMSAAVRTGGAIHAVGLSACRTLSWHRQAPAPGRPVSPSWCEVSASDVD